MAVAFSEHDKNNKRNDKMIGLRALRQLKKIIEKI